MTRYENLYGDDLVERLRKCNWEKADLGMINRRVLALAEAGELPQEIAQRLNPRKVKTPSWTPEQWHEREQALRASPPLGLELSARVRGARTRHRI